MYIIESDAATFGEIKADETNWSDDDDRTESCRLERTRREPASIRSKLGEPLKRSVLRSPLAILMRLLTLFLMLLIAPAEFLAQSSDGAIFERARQVLRQKTRVPLRLPTYLAAEEETYPLNAIIEFAAPKHYELQLAFTPDCTGGNACHYGMLSGQAVGRKAKRMRGKAVKLAQGITGYFIDAECGANCSDSTLSWQEGGYRYTVGIKAADVETLRKVASSAIVTGVVKM